MNRKKVSYIIVLVVLVIITVLSLTGAFRPINRYTFNDITDFSITYETNIDVITELAKIDSTNSFMEYYSITRNKNDSDKLIPLDGVISDAKTAVLIADLFLADEKQEYDETRTVLHNDAQGLWVVIYNRRPLPFGKAYVVLNQRDGGIVWYLFPANF